MKISVIPVVCFAVAMALGLSAADSQAQNRPISQVAILDLPYIFKNHARFQALSNDLRRELQAAEEQVKGSGEALQRLAQRLEEYRKGTPEFKQLEEEITRRRGEIQAQVAIHRKDFLEKEAKIYYEIYQEIMDRVKYYSESNGIVLVLRFSGDPIDPNDPQAVVKGLSKEVLYHNPAIDITPIILDQLNPAGNRPMNAPAGPVGSQPRPAGPQGVFPR